MMTMKLTGKVVFLAAAVATSATLPAVELSSPVLFTAMTGDLSVKAMPYGICGHVLHANFETRARHFDAMQLAGIKYVRSGIYGDSERELRYADTLIEDLDRRGMKLLMVLFGNEKDCCAPPKDLVGWSNSVDRIVRRYGNRVPVFEVWNEANLDGFFHGADPATYARLLNVTYAAGKAASRCSETSTDGEYRCWNLRTMYLTSL